MIKITDVAEKAGVSVTTVSRVLNNRGYISQKTRDRVYQAMKELNYQPNEMARALFRRKSNMIGLIIPTVAHPFFSELTYHLENYAHEKGYKLLLCNSNRDIAKERQYIDMLKKNQVDAIIMGSAVLDVEHYLNLNLPIVSFDRQLSGDIPLVTSDSYSGGIQAAEHLVQQGCRSFAYVYRGIGGPHHGAMLASGRSQGFGDELAKHGFEAVHLPLEQMLAEPLNHVNDIADFLKHHPGVDGIFASSDLIAAEIIQACRLLNRGIPQDVKLIGYDDTGVASLTSPRLSTIKQPIQQMSECTIESIISQIEGEDVPMINTFPVSFVRRETT
ncbi:LacI family DNA-binding transcriptional regulator [Paenibacillus sp. CAU 1782]